MTVAVFVITCNNIRFHLCLHANEGTYDIFAPKLVKSWRGNKFCDDFLNKVECNFDDGDCCGADVNTDYCDDCECHLGKIQ